MRATPLSQVRRKEQERLRSLEKARIIKQIGQQEQQFEKAVVPVEAQIQEIETSPQYYIQQKGMKGTPIYGKIAKGYAEEVVGYRYVTPYGTITDWSPRQRALAREYKYETAGKPPSKIIFPWQVDPSQFDPMKMKVTEIPQQKVSLLSRVLERFGKPISTVSFGAFTDIQRRAAEGDIVAQRILAEKSLRTPISIKTGTVIPIPEEPKEKLFPFETPPVYRTRPPIEPVKVEPTWKTIGKRIVKGLIRFPVAPIGVAPEVERFARAEAEFVRKLKEKPSIYERKAPEWLKEFEVKAQEFMVPSPKYKPAPWQKYVLGPELTKKYYELTAGTRFDPKTGKIIREKIFYEPGEREKIIEETLTPLKEAETYEQQQKAIAELEAKGVKVELTSEGDYEVADVEKIAPISKLGILVSLTDVIAKFGFFSPYMQTAAYKKGKAKTKSKTKQELVKKASKKAREKISSELDDIMIKAKTRSEGNLNLLKYMKDYKETAERLGIKQEVIRDNLRSIMEYAQARDYLIVRPEELPTTTVSTPMEIPVKELPTEIPVEEIAPPIYAGTGLYERYSPSEELYPVRVKPKPTEIGAETIFTGMAPEGKIEIEKFGAIPAMGVLGRLGVGVGLGIGVVSAAEERLKEQERLQERLVEQERLKEQERLVEQERLKEQERLRERVVQTSWLGLSTAQIQRQKLRERQRFRERLKPERLRPPRVGIPPIIPWWLSSQERKRLMEARRLRREEPLAYSIEVRRRGRFVPVVPFPVTKGEALFLGRRAVKRGAPATFRLVPVKKKPVKVGVPKITEVTLAPEFRKPVTGEPLVFIQRRPFRIKTPGEIREITMVGWEARKLKRRKEKWL